ncbi:M12 family metallo-peptidase [Runella salmonicolor]|uniref:M12 family metallo-peptidase n=1 Tax=Runella salmonicolor TaxID=2950278 RepID=A0ABT1FMM9_9BACT|nr:M12 family metallo-peptidase [Runella salmonicolor]MCP1383018.1 M12 family metallo-peptidase [Runella salmonicolor]
MKSFYLLLLCFIFSYTLPLSAQNLPQTTTLDIISLKKALLKAPKNIAQNLQNTTNNPRQPTVKLPNQKGVMVSYRVMEHDVLSPELSTQFPTIKTYHGVNIDNPKEIIRFDISPRGFHGIIVSPEGYKYIEPVNVKEGTYKILSPSEIEGEQGCFTNGNAFGAISRNGRLIQSQEYSNGATLRTYRMAIVATGEFTARNDTNTVSRIATIVNLTNAIWENEVAVHFTLAAVVSIGNVTTSTASTSRAQSIFDSLNTTSTLPYANYDIGHLLHYTGTNPPASGNTAGANGVAGPTPCTNTSKSRAWTQYTETAGFSAPDAMIVMVFAHEVAHQYNAPHTFNANTGACAGSNRMASGAYEPASGSTLMSYQGACSPQNLTGSRQTYFHTNTIKTVINSFSSTQGSCPTTSATGNTPPVANAGADYTIPKGTPFVLTGSGTDANGDALTYQWEQYDLAVSGDAGLIGSSAASSTTAPLFRSSISTNPVRTLPALSFILNNANDAPDLDGEELPQVARTMTFRLTAKDNHPGGGGVHFDATSITVASSGPFAITSQNTATTLNANGSTTFTLTWDVNGTDGAPVNCSNVKIMFSKDGGLTFPYVLSASTSNDGSETLIVPNYVTSTGRIKIEAVGNIFFDINNAHITIVNTSSCIATGTSLAPTNSITAYAGSSALALSLSPQYTTEYSSPVTGSLLAGDLQSTFAGLFGTNCVNLGPDTSLYDIYPFQVNLVGTYTFSATSSSTFEILNLYQNSFVPDSGCTNFLGSTRNLNNQNVRLNVSVTLQPGIQYYLALTRPGNFNPRTLSSYSISFTTPTGGTLGVNQYFNPGASYSYQYVIVNNTTGNVVDIAPTANLSNPSTYEAGSYSVYGVSYLTAHESSLLTKIGGSFYALQIDLANLVICGELSSNVVSITILPCTPSISQSTTISASTVVQAAQSVIATNTITDGTVIYRGGNYVQLNPTFNVTANATTTFTAYPSGCQ